MEPQSSPREKVDATATFRKPSNDAGNRIYRRRSPVDGSSSSDGSPIHGRNSNPMSSRKDLERDADDLKRKDDVRDLDRDSGRSHYDWSGDSHRHSDRHSSRGSRSYYKHDDRDRRDKYANDDDREYSRSSRSGRGSRSNNYSDQSRRESEYRSRDHPRDGDKYSRDKSDGIGGRIRDKVREKDSSFEYQLRREKVFSSDRGGSGRRHSSSNSEDVKHGERERFNDDKVNRDEKIDHRRSLGDYKSDRGPAYEEFRSHKNDSSSRRDSSGHRLRQANQGDLKSLDSEKHMREEKRTSEGRDRYKERHQGELEGPSEDGNDHVRKDQEPSAKKQKLFSKDEGNNNAEADENQSFSLKQAQEFTGKGSAEQACLTDSDIDAAKVAAMKAAELASKKKVSISTLIQLIDEEKDVQILDNTDEEDHENYKSKDNVENEDDQFGDEY